MADAEVERIISNNHAYGLGSLGPHAPGCRVGDIVQPAGCLQNQRPGLRPYGLVGSVVDDIGHRGLRDAAGLGNLSCCHFFQRLTSHFGKAVDILLTQGLQEKPDGMPIM